MPVIRPHVHALLRPFLATLLLIGLPVLTLSLTQAQVNTPDKQQQLRSVTTTTASVDENFSDTLRAIGTSVAPDNVMIAATVTEVIDKLHFKSGQQVNKGQLLITLSHKKVDADINALARRIQNQEKELKRLQRLQGGGHTQQQAIDSAQTELDISQQHLIKAKILLSEHYIRAPFEGLLGLRKISVGQLLSTGDETVSILRFNPMYIDFSIPAENLAALAIGDNIAIANDQTQSMQASILAFDNHVNPTTRSIKVRAKVNNEAATIYSGELFRLQLFTHRRSALIIPEKALTQKADAHYVFVIRDGISYETPVVIGTRRNAWVEITQGLTAEDHIVIEGLLWLNSGTQVQEKFTPSTYLVGE